MDDMTDLDLPNFAKKKITRNGFAKTSISKGVTNPIPFPFMAPHRDRQIGKCL